MSNKKEPELESLGNFLTNAQKEYPWFIKALGEFGQKGIEGERDNPRIVEYLKTTTYDLSNTKKQDEVPWCSAFVNWCFTEAGYNGTNSALAQDWHKKEGKGWGKKETEPKLGCLVVLERGKKNSGKGHVGFFIGFSETGKSIHILGGNQVNEVTIALRQLETTAGDGNKRKWLLSYRWPTAAQKTKTTPKDKDISPTLVLKQGSSLLKSKILKNGLKALVENLQRFLLEKGEKLPEYGDDGDFGKETKEAVKSYQGKKGFKKTGEVKVKYINGKFEFIFGEGVKEEGSEDEYSRKNNDASYQSYTPRDD